MKQSFQNSIWTIRDARIVLVARALSTAGVALFLAALVVPAIATMGIAGRVADGVDSRVVLTVASLAQAAAVTALGFAPGTVMIFASGVVISCAQAFAQPTWSALVPRIVGDERIGRAVSWQQGLTAVASPVGAGLGGLLVTMDHVAWGFWADAATYAVLAGAALLIRTRRGGGGRRLADARTGTPDAVGATETGWTAGLRVIARDRILLPLFASIIVFVVLVEGINPVEVFLVRDSLGATNWQYGLSDLFAGAGGLVGAAIAGRLASDTTRGRAAAAGFGAAGVVLIAMGLAPGFWVYAVLLAVMVAAFSTGNATTGALLMSRTSDAQRGRVSAAINGMARTGSLVALGLGGTANVLLGPRTTFVAAGVAGAVTMAIASIAILRAQRAERADAAATARVSSPE